MPVLQKNEEVIWTHLWCTLMWSEVLSWAVWNTSSSRPLIAGW